MDSLKLRFVFYFLIYYYPKQWVSLLMTTVLLSLSVALPLSFPFATIIERSWIILGPEHGNIDVQTNVETDPGQQPKAIRHYRLFLEDNHSLILFSLFTSSPASVVESLFSYKNLLEGHIPTNNQEVAISWQVAREYGIRVGDEILLSQPSQDDAKKRFIVRGIYKPYRPAGFRLWGYAFTEFCEGGNIFTRFGGFVDLPDNFGEKREFSLVRAFVSFDRTSQIIALSFLFVSILLGIQIAQHSQIKQMKNWAILYSLGLPIRDIFFLETIVVALRTLLVACLSVGLGAMILDYYFAVLFPWNIQYIKQLFLFYAIWGLATQFIVLVVFFTSKPYPFRNSLVE
ncbi:MAG: hypothetical protein ACLKAK_13105 [Alkaliphilus sp.]